LRGRTFSLRWRRGTKPEGRRAESGDGVLGDGAAGPSPPARGVGSAVSSPSGVRGGTPGKFEIWCNLRPQNSLQKWFIMGKLLQKAKTSRGQKDTFALIFFIGWAIAPLAPWDRRH